MKSTGRKRYLLRKPSKVRDLVKMMSFKWRGFEITIWNNKIYSFKYEYSLKPLTKQAKTICYKLEVTTIWDVTSNKLLSVAKERGKINVNEVLSPLWLGLHHK